MADSLIFDIMFSGASYRKFVKVQENKEYYYIVCVVSSLNTIYIDFSSEDNIAVNSRFLE